MDIRRLRGRQVAGEIGQYFLRIEKPSSPFSVLIFINP